MFDSVREIRVDTLIWQEEPDFDDGGDSAEGNKSAYWVRRHDYTSIVQADVARILEERRPDILVVEDFRGMNRYTDDISAGPRESGRRILRVLISVRALKGKMWRRKNCELAAISVGIVRTQGFGPGVPLKPDLQAEAEFLASDLDPKLITPIALCGSYEAGVEQIRIAVSKLVSRLADELTRGRRPSRANSSAQH